MEDQRSGRDWSAEGTVVEIQERDGARFATIVLEPNTVVQLPLPSPDISLGDRVVVDATLGGQRVRGAEVPRGAPPLDHAPPLPAADAHRRAAFHDYEHVLRMAGLFAVALVAFVGWRSWMVPADFGVYGHFRAGAIGDAAARPLQYAGQNNCLDCHAEAQQARLSGRHAQIACEACHGPLGAHARGDSDLAPVRPNPRALCLTCHAARPGMPAAFPRIAVKAHSEAGPCTDCHKAHAPGLS